MSARIPPRMRALVLDGVGFDHLRVRTVPTPRPGPRQLLARVDAAGVCTSLLKLIAQGPRHSYLYGWDVTAHPIILGDEGAVTLVAVGDDLSDRYRVGERFVIQPAVDHAPINHRERYRNQGRGVHRIAVGYTLPGHLAEYVLIPEEVLNAGCLLPVPDAAIPHAHAAIAEPFSCCIAGQDHHVHLAQADPQSPRTASTGLLPDGVTVVVGAGAMGRMHVDLALSYRPRAVLVADLEDERLALVERLFRARAEQQGIALHTTNPARVDLAAWVADLTDHRGADDVIVAVGARPAIEQAQHLLGRGAVLNLFGGLKRGEDVIALDTARVHYGEAIVTGSSGGSPWDVARTLDLIATGAIDPSVHITRIGDLAHVPDFLRMIEARAIDGKAVVYPHRRTDAIRAVEGWQAADEAAYLESGAEEAWR